jgi:ABC-type glycerol-3-phosphate transport system substrate-binding protein
LKKTLKLVTLIFLVLTLIIGCSSNNSGNSTNSGNKGNSGKEANSDSTGDASETPEDVTVRVWFGREDFIPGDKFEAFHKQYPHITVETDVIPLEQSVSDFMRNYNANNAPDVFQTYHENVYTLGNQGVLYDMTSEYEEWKAEDPDSYNNLLPQAFSITSYEGKPYGLAIHMGPRWNVYRSDWFAEAGINQPETWDDVLDAARKLKNEGYLEEGQYGYGVVVGAANAPNWFQSQFQSMGGQYTDTGLPIMDSDAGEYLINFYQTLMREGLAHPETLAWQSGEMRGAFISGNTAMATIGDNIFPIIQADLGPYGEKWKAMEQPARPGAESKGRPNASSWVMMVSKKTEHPDAVAKVLQYLSSTDIVREVAHRYQPTTNITVMTEDAYYEAKPWQAELEDAYGRAEFIPGHLKHPELQRILLDLMQEAVANPETPAAEIAKKYQEQIDVLDQ